jgi:hypothetical protein
MANDGGVFHTIGAASNWQLASGLNTLSPINLAGVAVPGISPALYMGTGDNDDFFSLDGGASWGDPVSLCGDCDPWFADPAQPFRVLSFAAREGVGGVAVYTNPEHYPNPSANPGDGSQRTFWVCPSQCNAVSSFSIRGDRPIVLTPPGVDAPADGDYILIGTKQNGARVVFRKTNNASMTSSQDWEDQARAFQYGPDLPLCSSTPFLSVPPNCIDVVQASGGHNATVLYAGDPGPGPNQDWPHSMDLWKWSPGMSNWQQIVPSPAGTPVARSATIARRFFVSPYNPNLIYIIDETAIKRSDDGGRTWQVDRSLDALATESHAFLYSADFAVLKDIIFDRNEGRTRFAMGNAGVFFTLDGQNWQRLISASAMPSHPVAAYFDPISDPCNRSLYVAFSGRGLLRLGPIPYPVQVVNVTAAAGEKVSDPSTSWQSGFSPAENVEHLASVNANRDLLVFSWSAGSNWQVINATQSVPGRNSMTGPVAAWQTLDPLNSRITEKLAGPSSEGDLVIFSSTRGPHVTAWQSGNINASDITQQIAPHPKFFAPLTSWQSQLNGNEYLAGMSTDGQLLVVPLTAFVGFLNITQRTGQRIGGALTSWQGREGSTIVEHLAGISPNLGRGDLLVFSSSATPTNPAWQASSPVNFVNVSGRTGQQISSAPTSWQTINGSNRIEHLAASNPSGDLLVFFSSPGNDWQFVNVSQITGQKITGPVTNWQTLRCGFNVEHLAAASPSGDLLEFYWSPQHDWRFVNISQDTGQKISGPATSWQTPNGPFNVEHLASRGPNGDLLLFFTEGSEQLLPPNLSLTSQPLPIP